MSVAIEVWTANIATGASGLGIFWTDNIGAATAWNKVAALPFPAAGLLNIYLTKYGERLYIVGINSDDSNHIEIWKTDNPKDGSPTWVNILETTVDTLGGNPITLIDQNHLGDYAIAVDPDTGVLAAMVGVGAIDTYYGEYINNAWNWTIGQFWEGAYGSTGEMDYRIAMKNLGGGTWNVYEPPSVMTLEVIGGGPNNYTPYGLWRSSTRAVTMLHDNNGGGNQLRTLITAELGFTYSSATYDYPNCLTGAFDGDEVLMVTRDGYFVRSADGSAADQTAVWASRLDNEQFVCDLDSEGGGVLIWTSTINSADVCVRGSTDGGANWVDYTGDMLSSFATDNKFRPASLRLVYSAAPPANMPRLRNTLINADGGIGLRAQTDGAIATFSEVHGSDFDIQVDADVTLHVYGVQYATANLLGTLEPLPGDRAAFDAAGYAARHTNDTDSSDGIHHTLGAGAGQAAAGDHTHDHDDLTSVTANQHHNQAHILGAGGDHSDAPTNQTNGFVKRNAANNAWEEVPYGTGSNTVAEGNHAHDVGQYRQFTYTVSGGDFSFIIDGGGNPVMALQDLE